MSDRGNIIVIGSSDEEDDDVFLPPKRPSSKRQHLRSSGSKDAKSSHKSKSEKTHHSHSHRTKEKKNKKEKKYTRRNNSKSEKEENKFIEIDDDSPPKKTRKRSQSFNISNEPNQSSGWMIKKKRKSEDAKDISDVVDEVDQSPSDHQDKNNNNTRSVDKFLNTNLALSSSQLTSPSPSSSSSSSQTTIIRSTSEIQKKPQTKRKQLTSKSSDSSSPRVNDTKSAIISPYFMNTNIKNNSNANNGYSSINKNNNNNHTTRTKEVWVMKYTPQNEHELAIRKNKLLEVKQWLQSALSKLPKKIPSPKILILTGPCGSGKTAMIQVLAKQLNAELSEWIDPSLHVWKDADANLIGSESRMKKFKSFMLRTERYNSISFITGADDFSPISKGKIILIDQFPYLHDQNQKNEFFTILGDFLRTSLFPLVLIMSDDNNTGNSNLYLLPPEIISSSLVTTIHINAVVLSTITRVLKSIAASESFNISNEKITSIAENSAGDIRSAINTLQFYLIANRNPPSTSKSRTKKYTKRSSKSSSSSSSTIDDQISDFERDKKLGLFGCRDISLSLFHAIGKICYNKRLTEGVVETRIEKTNPKYRLPLKSKPENILDNLSVSPALFNTYLHENYLDFFDNLNDIASASLYLSDSDLLDSSFGYLQKENPRLSSYVGLISTRGMLFSNASAKKTTYTFHQMYKPQSTKYYQKKIDFNNAIDKLITQQSSPSNNDNLRDHDVLLSPSITLRSEVLPFVNKLRNIPDLLLTSGQTMLLSSLCTFHAHSRNHKLDKLDKGGVVAEDDDDFSDSAIPSSLQSRQWYTKHQADIENRDSTPTCSKCLGGSVGILEEDIIDDDDDYI